MVSRTGEANVLITRADRYREIYDGFRWRVPERFNMAVACCDRWAAAPDRVALIHERPDGTMRRYSFRDMQRVSLRVANLLVGLGLARGDRVLLLLGQRPETAMLHLGAWRAGMISVLCSVLFGADAIQYRLALSGARLLVTDAANLPKVLEIRDRVPALAHVLCVDGPEAGVGDFHALVGQARAAFTTVDTLAEEPAFICFTSGTTGPPKGTLHAHRALLGHMPCVEIQHASLGTSIRARSSSSRACRPRRPARSCGANSARGSGAGAKARPPRRHARRASLTHRACPVSGEGARQRPAAGGRRASLVTW